MQFIFSSFKRVIYFSLFAGLVLSATQCGIDGSGQPGGNNIGIEIIDGHLAVNPIYVRTGINSSTVIAGHIKATTYVGRSLFKEIYEDQEDSPLSFNPGVNFNTLNE